MYKTIVNYKNGHSEEFTTKEKAKAKLEYVDFAVLDVHEKGTFILKRDEIESVLLNVEGEKEKTNVIE